MEPALSRSNSANLLLGSQKSLSDDAKDENDPGHGTRSALLEDFRTNKTNKKYELKVWSHGILLDGESQLELSRLVLTTIDMCIA